MSCAARDSALAASIESYQQRIERVLDHELFRDDTATTRLRQAMRYSVLGGGKRLRPVLVYLTGTAFAAPLLRLDAPAAAVELIHAYSLIHDDLPAMDDDDLRRGRPTCHKVYGDNVAILAGDALYAEALRHLATHQRAEPAALLGAVGLLAGATCVDGMVGGQYLDVKELAPEGPEGLRRLHALKTGRLIAASVQCVLELFPTTEPETIQFGRFASELGVLFQIVDDILDVTGTDAALGKPSGSDERHGKRTYVSEHGLERARELATASHAAARSALAGAVPAGAPELEQITDFIYTRRS
jgi:geranylgeranyl diphosphate synthase type II